ncbi:MAG: hypothetical protein JWM82_999 [Myxococcales bacterium]|nr:hypothetical protein [Myxococcales bacterium]
MNITTRKIELRGLLLLGGLLFAGCAKSNDVPPPADAAAGAGGQSGDAASAIHPDDAGRCPMQGAFAHNGVCICQADVPTVCDNVCTDVQNDVDHCGDCATKCPATSVCNQGRCSVPPVVLLAPPAATTGADGGAASCGPLRMALAGTTLYWTDQAKGTINSMPTSGGAPTVLASGQPTPTMIKLVGNNLFWLAGGATKIMRSGLATGTPSVVATAAATDGAIGGFDVTPDGLTVYFSSVKSDLTARPLGTISKVAAAGGAVTVVGTEDHGLPGAIAVDGTTVSYVVDQTSDVNAIHVVAGTLAQCGLPGVGGGDETGVNCDRLGRSQGSLLTDAMFAFGGSAYWVATDNFRAALVASATHYDSLGSSVGSRDFTALTLDGTTTGYLAEAGARNCLTMNDKGDCVQYGAAEPAFVEKIPLVKGSTTVPLARFFDPKDPTMATSASSVAVDATKVYFARTDCAILSVAK